MSGKLTSMALLGLPSSGSGFAEVELTEPATPEETAKSIAQLVGLGAGLGIPDGRFGTRHLPPISEQVAPTAAPNNW